MSRPDPNEPILADRGPRKTRDAEKRTAPKWTPPQMLPDPRPEPGYGFRWIRISTMGETDSMNLSTRLREGYEPVKASDHPEVEVQGAEGRFQDNIIIGGLMLCKIPIEISEQRDEYYRRQAQAQMTSVDSSLMRLNDSRMPLFNERKSEVAFGNGSS